ncbi:MAG: metalloregulator ArsR/SmtB family transcription factor [Desulfarculaceae bacterium]|nr:metalloregulator ArsR/SmtB family transcription factor [Desulfarculaceae bacterium]
METVLKIFKALSDQTRLRIFNILAGHELNVNEIVEVLQMGQSRISRHLKILSDCGLVRSRRDGSFVYYQSEQDETRQILMRFIRNALPETQELGMDFARSATIVGERKQKTRSFFNKVAENWDALKLDIFGDFDLNRALVEKGVRAGCAVDLGCGTGELMELISDISDQVIGVDSSPKMLDQARTRMKDLNARFDFRLGEIEHIPLKDSEADLAFINMVLNHIAVPANVIRETCRILKPGGFFILADLSKHNFENIKSRFGSHWMGFEKDEIEKWLTEAGFMVKDVTDYPVELDLEVNVFTAVKPNL